MKNVFSVIAAGVMLTGLSACAPQPPLQLQEPVMKPDYIANYAEDRITLRFAPGQSTLDAGQQDYIRRFVQHYKGSKHTAIFVSLLVSPEIEDIGTLPRHRPDIVQAYNGVAAEVHKNGVRPRMTKEVDTFGQATVTEARARKAIVDTAMNSTNPGDADTMSLAPNPADLQRETRIAVVAREYEVQSANCSKQGYHSWEGSSYAGSGILTGCAVHNNLLAQVKDHSVMVQGEDMDPEYYSAFSVLQLRKAQDAEYDQVFQQAKSGVSGGFKE